jgi:hypothetical protein
LGDRLCDLLLSPFHTLHDLVAVARGPECGLDLLQRSHPRAPLDQVPKDSAGVRADRVFHLPIVARGAMTE